MLSKYAIPVFFILAIVVGCKISNNDRTDYAYIGGEIINPKNNHVGLYNSEGELVDSLELDLNNRFIHRIEDLKPGLYSLTHGGEIQIALLEPQDSIMFRLNTYDFDESLVFTGEGAEKNNYLIKTFLSNEQEMRKLMKYSKMEPEEFNTFVEQRRQKQLNEFNRFNEQNNESPVFQSIATAIINYNCYADKEIYPFAYFGNNKLIHVRDLPEDFYMYRQDIDYNARHLSNSFAYNRFLFSHIDNLALNSYYKDNAYHSKFNRHSMTYNKSKLDLIDSIIEDEAIRNYLLKYKTRDYISHNHTQEEAVEILEYYLAKSTNEEDKAYMKELVSSLEFLREGHPLPDLAIVSYEQAEHNLKDIIRKPTLIYFWSSHSKLQYRNSHYIVNQLKEKYPQMDFISININDNDDKFWKDIVGNYNFPKENEFKFKNSRRALKTLAVNYLNKAIIVDNQGHILHPNVNIFDSDFDAILEVLIQQKHLTY